MTLIIIFYRAAVGTTVPEIQNLQGLLETASSPAELQSLAIRLADLRAADPYTNFLRAASGSILLVGSAILVGILFDRTRQQEAESRVAQQLRRFFAPTVADAVMAAQDGIGLTSARKELTVLFTDLRGFTRLSERMEPKSCRTCSTIICPP